MKRILCVILVVLMMVSICACGSSAGNNQSSQISENAAISTAKADRYVLSAIARKFNFKQYYTPKWGTCTAEKTSDGWSVTLKGTISGYTDDYSDDFVSGKKFTATVNVSDSGFVDPLRIPVSYG